MGPTNWSCPFIQWSNHNDKFTSAPSPEFKVRSAIDSLIENMAMIVSSGPHVKNRSKNLKSHFALEVIGVSPRSPWSFDPTAGVHFYHWSANVGGNQSVSIMDYIKSTKIGPSIGAIIELVRATIGQKEKLGLILRQSDVNASQAGSTNSKRAASSVIFNGRL